MAVNICLGHPSRRWPLDCTRSFHNLDCVSMDAANGRDSADDEP